MKVVNQVLQTTDYELFSFLKGNRGINRAHLVRLRKSIEKVYLFSPLIVNEKYQIIDGQHRFTSAKDLGLPVNFIVVPGYALKEVQTLNSNMGNWGQVDYLNAYCDLGYPHYLKLRAFMSLFPDFGIKASQNILTQSSFENQKKQSKEIVSETNKRGVYAVRPFEEGEFQVSNYNAGVKIAEKIMQIKPYYDGFHRATFVRAMIGVLKVDGYDHSQMIARIAANPRSMVHCSNVGQYKEMLEEIYNFRTHKANKLYFKYTT